MELMDTILVNTEEETTENPDLTEAYAALGKAFYENRFEEPTPELLPYFDNITALLQPKSHVLEMELEEPAEKAPEAKFCGKCGNPVLQEDLFCGECGNPLQ